MKVEGRGRKNTKHTQFNGSPGDVIANREKNSLPKPYLFDNQLPRDLKPLIFG